MVRSLGFYSDPHVQFLSQLLEEIGDGGLQVPRFQRPLVWNWERRLELLRSIRDGIPIGAIMVWRTSTVLIDCYDNLGPHPLKRPLPGATRQYILDGVQRLSTLYGALHRSAATDGEVDEIIVEDEGEAETDEESEAHGMFDVFFDPRSFDFLSPETADNSAVPMMPMAIIFDSVALLRFQRSLADAGYEDEIKATDQVARAFRDYKIPIIPITTDDIDLATRTFQRINSQGTRMTETHMVHALTWKPTFDLQHRIEAIKKGILAEHGWALLNDDPILKTCKAAFGLDVYKTNAQELSTALVAQPGVLDRVAEAIGLAAKFLWRECGIRSPDLVPYALQIVVLAETFRMNPTPSDRVIELLTAWFWMTTYGELFAGMSGDRVQTVIADMHEMAGLGEARWTWKRPFEERPLRRQFDFRAARAKAFAFGLAGVQDRVIGERAGTKILAAVGRKGLAQVLPWRADDKEAYSSPGNRFLLPPFELNSFRYRLLSGELTDADKRAHVITSEAEVLIADGNYLGFVNRRVADVVAIERKALRPSLEKFASTGLRIAPNNDLPVNPPFPE